MPILKIQTDVANATASLDKYIKALDGVDNRLKDIVVTGVKLNASGEVISQKFKALAQDGGTVSGVFKEITKTVKGITTTVDASTFSYEKNTAALQKQNNLLKDFKTSVENVSRALQYYVAYRGFNLITDQIKEGVTAAKDMQIQISLIRTISQDTQQSFAKWGTDLRKVSDNLGMDLKDVTKAAYDAVSNQVAKGSAVAPFLQQAGEFARVTGSTLTDSVNLFSSAINAYGLSAADAEKIAAVFFKTIDEGRVVTADLANTYGRVAIQGKGLGISFEEINAMLAIMTKQGLKTEDAMTLITNVMNKLEKPTEATSKLFKEWGVNTGEQAVKTYKAAGVLQKIIGEVMAGNSEFSDLFDEIRGRKGIAALANDFGSFDTFLGKLNNTKQTIEDYKKAIDIRGESPADKMQKEFTKLKNAFTGGIGQDLITLTVQAAELVKKFDQLTGGAGTTATAANKLISIFVGATAAVVGFRVALSLATATAAAFGVTSSRLVPQLAVLAAAAAAVGAIKGTGVGSILSEKSSAADEVAEFIQRRRMDEAKASATGTGKDGTTVIGENIAKSFEKALQRIAEASKTSNRALDEIRGRAKEAANALNVTFQGYTDGIKNFINDLRKTIADARNEIEKSQKAILGFKAMIDGLEFDTKMKYATDAQKESLTDDKIKSLTREAEELYRRGDAESLAKARRNFEEAARLEQQNFERRTDRNVEQYRQDVASGRVTPGALDAKGNAVFGVDTLPLQERLNALKAKQQSYEEGIQASQLKQMGNAQQQLAIEQERLRKLETGIARFNKLDFIGADGKIKDEFKVKGSERPDSAKILDTFNKAAKDLTDNAPDAQSRIQLEALIFDRRRALYDEMKEIERKENIETARRKALADRDAQEKTLESIKKGRTEVEANQKSTIESLAAQGENFETARKYIFGTGPGIDGFGMRTKYRGKGAATGDESKRIEKFNQLLDLYDGAVADYQKNVDTLKKNASTNIVGGVATARIEDIDAVEKRARMVLDILQKITDLSQGAGKTVIIPGQQKATSGIEVDEFIQDQLRKLRSGGDKAQSLLYKEQLLNAETSDPNEVLRKLKREFPDIEAGTKALADTFSENFKKMSDAIDPVLRKLEQLNLLQGGNMKIGFVGGDDQASYFADGGVVGFPGQPRGSDRYPIWAAKDEFIVNAESSRAFRPMLEAINRNRSPRYYAEGGVVGGDTNIGDINITVQGGQSPTQTARVLGQQLERELRRRSITFTPTKRR